jgi:ATP-binding cassette subfamily B protein
VTGNIPATSIEQAPTAAGLKIPDTYWSVLPIITSQQEADSVVEPERLLLKGAVLVRILGKLAEPSVGDVERRIPLEETATLPPDLEAALTEPIYRPEREVLKVLRQDGLLTPSILVLAVFMATLGVTIEALLFQGMVQIGQGFSLVSQRILAVIAILAFVVAPFLLEFPISSTVLRMGRRLETRLRVELLEKIPHLGDRYFRSRLTSDMTQRAHDLRQLRMLPNLGISLLRTGFQLILTTIGVIWLDPISAPLAILGTIFFVALSLVTRPLTEERDLRLRTHIGALSRFYLDALLCLVPLKTHGAERAMRRQHEMQLFEWVRSGREYYNVVTLVQSLGTLLYSGFAILIIINYLVKGGQSNEILLLFYWTLSLPALGQSLADMIQQYPMQRNRILRLLEPLSAPDEEIVWHANETAAQPSQPAQETSFERLGKAAIGVQIKNASLQAGGHTILKDIGLTIKPGEHIAIVGPSGAGKSSLVGLLLGWHRPSQGEILIDGQILDGERLQSLRRETAWVDPAVQLWNRTLYDNLRYGIEHEGGTPFGDVIQNAALYDVLERLPDGLKTVLGEGGGLVSGGEGQRVRLGRAMLRPEARLVILDEPFRGLDRARRRELLAKAREHWKDATLLCVTHDVGETVAFPRVLVIENGLIVEDGAPTILADQMNTRYRSMLQAEEGVRQNLWASANWRRITLEDGHLRE